VDAPPDADDRPVPNTDLHPGSPLSMSGSTARVAISPLYGVDKIKRHGSRSSQIDVFDDNADYTNLFDYDDRFEPYPEDESLA